METTQVNVRGLAPVAATGSIGGGIRPGEPQKREVPNQLSHLNRSIDELSAVVGNLEDRLVPILQTGMPVESKKEEPLESLSTELGSTVRSASHNIEGIRARIHRILDGLEL